MPCELYRGHERLYCLAFQLPVMSEYQKSEGTTSAERYLAQLCQRSFLSLWNYSNPYTDDGKIPDKSTSVGKELCDQLVVFGNHVIILSDKDCEYTNHANPLVNWARYYRKAILKSAAQMWRAEKWLREFRSRLFEDATCLRPLRALLPPVEQMKVHRILVAHGVTESCRAARGGSGSLAIDTHIVEANHHEHQKYAVEPFVIGHVDPTKGFVHVFDDVSLNVVMESLDTITDFVEYLERKEQFLTVPGRRVYADGEEEMLAYYVQNLNAKGEHDFPPIRRGGDVEFEIGEWYRFLQSPERVHKKEADEISYSWDNLIDYIAGHYEADTMHYSSDKSFAANEKGLRLMAQEPRRKLAESFMQLVESTPTTQRKTRVIRSIENPGVAFVICLLPHLPGEDYEAYRKLRRAYVEGYCRVTKLVFFDDLNYVVGLGTESGGPEHFSSIDLMSYAADTWEAGEKEAAELIQKQTGFLTQVRAWTETADEYFDKNVSASTSGPAGR